MFEEMKERMAVVTVPLESDPKQIARCKMRVRKSFTGRSRRGNSELLSLGFLLWSQGEMLRAEQVFRVWKGQRFGGDYTLWEGSQMSMAARNQLNLERVGAGLDVEETGELSMFGAIVNIDKHYLGTKRNADTRLSPTYDISAVSIALGTLAILKFFQTAPVGFDLQSEFDHYLSRLRGYL